ncbi:RagB/SusD family nutrient uptake outer membrane protein [Elizabethkingia anophelis]|uniref:RagB/SusD family nutrient uptake outer membrane protein n=1 Tax=Elizabethkingia anophelis TaxID=1117645 RepID=UPI000B3642F3|nr:RagB/SusD family nutrient uptake outer membrane protein [Elizabethkingia anophelis]
MKHIYKIYKMLIVFLLSFMISCEDYISVDLPSDQLPQEMVFRDPGLAKSAVAGLYRSLMENGFLSGDFSGAGINLGAYADELVSYQPSGTGLSDFYNLTVIPRSTNVESFWQFTYNQIYQANVIIKGMDNSVALDQGLRKQLKGEALFVRALLHYYLVESYGSIPYITGTDYKENTTAGKIPIQDVYEKIEQDLKDADALLPVNNSGPERFRPSKESVSVILTRLYLLQQKFQDVINTSNNLVSNSQYKLNSDITTAYQKNNPSTIWQFSPINASAVTFEANIYPLLFAPPFIVALTPDLVKSFDQNDLRLKNWIGSLDDFAGNRYYYAWKYKQRNPAGGVKEYSIVLRLEEVILNRAEAFVQLGNIPSGVAELNKIVTRAGLPPVTLTGKDALLQRIEEERRHELFTEHAQRFFNLKRTGRLSTVMKSIKPSWKDSYNVLPIPEKELLLNPNLYPQNEGY